MIALVSGCITVYLSVDRRSLAAETRQARQERAQLLATQLRDAAQLIRWRETQKRQEKTLRQVTSQRDQLQARARQSKSQLQLLAARTLRLVELTRASGVTSGRARMLVVPQFRSGLISASALRVVPGQAPSLWLKRGKDLRFVRRLTRTDLGNWSATFRLWGPALESDELVVIVGPESTRYRAHQRVAAPGKPLLGVRVGAIRRPPGFKHGPTPSAPK